MMFFKDDTGIHVLALRFSFNYIAAQRWFRNAKTKKKT